MTTEPNAFWGIPLDGDVCDALDKQVGYMRPRFSEIDWYEPQDWHLTLKFLGPRSRSELEGFHAAMQSALPNFPPFVLRIKGLGFFERRGRRSILWAGVELPNSVLENLVSLLEDVHARLGVPRETRPYYPHITLGRVRRHCHEDLLQIVEDLAGHSWGTQQVSEIALMKRQHDSSGHRYGILAKIP